MPGLQNRTVIVGLSALVVGGASTLLPVVLPRTNVNKYLVVVGIVLGCWGLSCILLEMTELIRARRRR
jgi:hypothetical protein